MSEPKETHDKQFAPVNQGGDARGRTVPSEEDEGSGTGVPGVGAGHPDALPPTEEGVREAEEGDASGE